MTEEMKERMRRAAEHAKNSIAVVKHLIQNVEKAPQAALEVGRWIKAGIPLRTDEEVKIWQKMCEGPPTCQFYKPIKDSTVMHCAACRCPNWKMRLATTGCPIGRTPIKDDLLDSNKD